MDALKSRRIKHTTFNVSGEPTTDQVSEGVRAGEKDGCDYVIGFGGGSALDAAKAISAVAANGGLPGDYLEVIGRHRPITRRALPFIAIPTTAGTGTEVTQNAVLVSPAQRVKASLRSPLMLPRLAIIDPELTFSLPPALTATTGLDALAQVIEPFVCNRANPLTDALCRDGIRRISRSLARACQRPDDLTARENMSLAALFGGLALANAGLGAVHGLAGPLGGTYPAPHGALCGCLLPHAMAVNIAALRQRAPDCEALNRFSEIAQIVTGVQTANAEDGAEWVAGLCEALNVPSLARWGVREQDFPLIVHKAKIASSMQKNPVQLEDAEITDILRRSI
jgi:alcohol dehydrogenase class IV